MKSSQAQEAFGALSQETRLAILRFLIREGTEALPAGHIADKIGVPPSTFSFHVAALERAGLVQSRRVQRQILYSPNLDGIRDLLTFLLEDCCGGRPEICADLFSAVQKKAACCAEDVPSRRVAKRAR